LNSLKSTNPCISPFISPSIENKLKFALFVYTDI
jgi:hypothetical protein